MPNEDLIDRIVEKCKGNVSIFLGAGAFMPIGLPDMVSFWENAYGNDFFKDVTTGCQYELNSKNTDQIAQNKTSILRHLIQMASITVLAK